MDEAAREAAYEKIIAAPGVVWSVRVVSALRIDEVNILMASLEAMRLSLVDVLERRPEDAKRALALIDGPFSPWKSGPKYEAFQAPQPPLAVDLDVEPVKGGDGKVYCIAAASIIAKVTRDRLMHQYHEVYPMYGWPTNKGYPTASHVAALAKHGPCAIHRRTFAPLKSQAIQPPSARELERVDELARGVAAGGASGRGA